MAISTRSTLSRYLLKAFFLALNKTGSSISATDFGFSDGFVKVLFTIPRFC